MTVVLNLNDDFTSGIPGGKDHLAHRVLAGLDAIFLIVLDAMVHGISDDVHDGITDAVHDGFIHFSVLAHQGQFGALIQLFAHITHNAVHLLEGARDRDHPQGHGHILQLVGELAQLTCGLGELIQIQSLQIWGRCDHAFGNDDFAHQSIELIQLVQVHADQALLGMLSRGGKRPSLRSRSRFGGRLSRRFFCSLRRSFRSGSGFRLGGSVLCLIGTHRTGSGHSLNGVVTLFLVLEKERETMFNNLLRSVLIGFHVGRFKGKISLRTEVPDGVDYHKGAQILHAAALVEHHVEGVGEFCVCSRCLSGSLGSAFGSVCRGTFGGVFGSVRFFALNFSHQALNIFQKGVDRIIGSFT